MSQNGSTVELKGTEKYSFIYDITFLTFCQLYFMA